MTHFNGIIGRYTVINVDEDLKGEFVSKRPDRIVALMEGRIEFICPIELKSKFADPVGAKRQLEGGAEYMERKLTSSKDFKLFPVIVYIDIKKEERRFDDVLDADWFVITFNEKQYAIYLMESGNKLIDEIRNVHEQ